MRKEQSGIHRGGNSPLLREYRAQVSPLRSLKDRRSPVRPYSRVLQRGALGGPGGINGSTRLGRMIRALEAELITFTGGNPDIKERLLIDRIVKLRVQLDLFEEKLGTGNWTPHDQRTYGGLNNAYRLALHELKPAAKPADPMASVRADLARFRAKNRAEEPA